MLKLFIVLTLVLNSAFSHALSGEKQKYLKDNGIVLMTPDIEDRYVDEFLISYKKFPADLSIELIGLGRKIHLIQGRGVTDDPSWSASRTTFDGRDWSTVPGAGGAPYWNKPTRIVVNRLNEGHGSSNLYLHEEAHAMDLSFGAYKISKSDAFQDLLKNPSVTTYLDGICPQYCEVPQEAFAELFARYYSDSSSRKKLERAAPEAFQFIKNLHSIREASKKGQAVSGN